MFRKIIVLSLFGLATGNATAGCVLARGVNESRTLILPATTLHISADAKVDKSIPFAKISSPAITYPLGYDECLDYTLYGKDVFYLTNQDNNRIYPTKVAGVGVKLIYIIGGKEGNFPSDQIFHFTGGESKGTIDYSGSPSYRVEFYKIDAPLKLNNAQGEVVLEAGDLAYNWIEVKSPSNYALKLFTNQITVVSTPVCRTELEKTVDFGTVTHKILSTDGVERPLDFSLTCETDYGSYSASASITSRMASANGKYIDVADSHSNIGQMGIEIYNSKGGKMALDGTTIEKPLPVKSKVPLKFNWKAKLINTGSKFRPMNGAFSAQAEILLQVN